MLKAEIVFIFYLAAVICFLLAAAGGMGKAGRGTSPVALVPLGLALWLFPAMWNTGAAAF